MGTERMSIVFSQKSKEDVVEIALYIASGNVRAAKEFRKALERTYSVIETLPKVGSLSDFGNLRLVDMRMLPIQKFEKYLLVYRVTKDSIEIIRVIHGARDLPLAFGESNEKQ